MSGSGSSDLPLGGGSSGAISDCASLFFTTALASPVAGVIATLKIGEVLSLKAPTPPSTVVLAVTAAGSTAGSVISPHHAKMVDCMRQGFGYVAIVRSISGGACDVEIRPESTWRA